MTLPTAGIGGFGLVTDLGDGTVVKTPRKSQRSAVDALVREAAALQVLRDVPGVISPVSFGYDDEGPWLRLLKIDEKLLSQVEIPWPINLAVWLMVARTILDCHARGVIHRDIKPENIFSTPQGPLLIDFGLAYIKGQPDLKGQQSYVFGTPYIMPPEVIADPEMEPSETHDAWQLGMLLHQIEDGCWPIETGSATTVMKDVLDGRIEEIRPELQEARRILLGERDIQKGIDEVARVMLAALELEPSTPLSKALRS